VHVLSSGRRLSRYGYLAQKPPKTEGFLPEPK
jgi:hypothetical protein